jgi:hypothetical protein
MYQAIALNSWFPHDRQRMIPVDHPTDQIDRLALLLGRGRSGRQCGANRDPCGWSIGVLFYTLLPYDQLPAIVGNKFETAVNASTMGPASPGLFPDTYPNAASIRLDG